MQVSIAEDKTYLLQGHFGADDDDDDQAEGRNEWQVIAPYFVLFLVLLFAWFKGMTMRRQRPAKTPLQSKQCRREQVVEGKMKQTHTIDCGVQTVPGKFDDQVMNTPLQLLVAVPMEWRGSGKSASSNQPDKLPNPVQEQNSAKSVPSKQPLPEESETPSPLKAGGPDVTSRLTLLPLPCGKGRKDGNT